MTLLISEHDIAQVAMSIKAAIPVMEETFRLAGEGSAENPPRYRLPYKNGFMQFGPGTLHSKQLAGFKLLANFGKDTSMRKNLAPDGLFLHSMETGELLSIMHCHTISTFRTSAVTAVAAKYLTPENASSVGLYGAGRIAEGQLEAICAVRPIKTARVYSRTKETREAFCGRMTGRLGIEMIPCSKPEEVPRDADIVITATTSKVPVLCGDWLTRPSLVVAAGSNHWYTREVDGKVIERSELVVVDHKEQSRAGSGNILWAVSHGIITWDRIREFGEIVTRRVPLPDFNKATILFGSHGLGITDTAIAARTYELVKARGLGTAITL